MFGRPEYAAKLGYLEDWGAIPLFPGTQFLQEPKKLHLYKKTQLFLKVIFELNEVASCYSIESRGKWIFYFMLFVSFFRL